MASLRLHNPLLLSPSFRSQRLRYVHQNNCAFLTQFPSHSPILHPSIPISKLYSFASFSVSSQNNHFRISTKDASTGADLDSETVGSRFVRDAAWVGVVTMSCKILGLLREISVAATFGIGPMANAFKYAWLLPGFASSLIGGVNGPVHATMATTLSKLSKKRQQNLFQHSIAIMFLVGGIVGILVFVFAESIIHIYAPGLWILSEGVITREIAVAQLKIMTPCIVFAGPVGLGFGYMSAEGNNIIPSLSPALSSILIIASCVYISKLQVRAVGYEHRFYGGLLVSIGASIGAFLQWIIQVVCCRKTSYFSLPVSWVTIIKNKDVHKFFSLLFPATISSGMGQIASLTDLYFASLIPGAGAALSYSYLFAMAPLGILSSMILLPLLPTITILVKDLSWKRLKGNLKRAVLLCMASFYSWLGGHRVLVLPIYSTMSALSRPIIRCLFERHMFDSSATALVSCLFVCYSLGSPFYIVRELLSVVFYAVGDGFQPFLVSIGAVAVNAILDWLFVTKFYLGAQGLALSTSFATAMSMITLYFLLLRKAGASEEADHAATFYTCLLLFSSCIISGVTAFLTHQMLCDVLCSFVFHRFNLQNRIIGEGVAIALGGVAGMWSFFFPAMLLHLVGMKLVRDLFRTLTSR